MAGVYIACGVAGSLASSVADPNVRRITVFDRSIQPLTGHHTIDQFGGGVWSRLWYHWGVDCPHGPELVSCGVAPFKGPLLSDHCSI